MNERQKILFKRIIVIAMLVALCFAATFIQIKMPTGDMVHLGNFVMIMAALLLGGLEGGAVGSLGMGLYDIIFYTTKPSTIIRTFILKFLVGFLVGFLFRLVLKKKIKTEILLIASTIFFVLVTGVSLIFFFIGDKSSFGFSNGLISVIQLSGGKTLKVSLLIPIFSFLFALGMGFALIFSKKLRTRSKAALFAITIAILVNILGEFLLRWSLEGIFNVTVQNLGANDAFTTSLIVATSKIPGSLITGFISILLAVLIYEPVYFGVKHLDAFKDDTVDLIDEEKKQNAEETKELVADKKII